jgi:diaminohydroxyphosphoribosylaminopyrimidine deaminase/5-amino-6-(5-phosphoribosylamino)uracil reductase
MENFMIGEIGLLLFKNFALVSGEIYMHRAMELARLGFGNVSPNPMVGCVIVCEDKIIGEGFHQQYGGPHAEVNAISSVKDKDLLRRSTVYVSLEPCAHFGKTPPCANLLVKHQVKKVVISNVDPNPLVAGKGINIIKNGGVEVETGLMEQEGADLNKRFFKSIEKKRPYVILKWAQTADGFIARENYDSKWISNDISRKLVHKWRAEEDAILVGKNTAMYDNPSLNVRDWVGKDPLRIVIDHELRLDRGLNLFDKTIPTICYSLRSSSKEDNLELVKLPAPDFLTGLLHDLHQRSIQSVIVEGGASTINSFIAAGLWDEARVFEAPVCFGAGIGAPRLRDAAFDGREEINGDILTYFKRN